MLYPLLQEDVNRLDQDHFLRLNGARNIGIRTSFGVPVVSRWGVTFVIVFYSRMAVQVCVFECLAEECLAVAKLTARLGLDRRNYVWCATTVVSWAGETVTVASEVLASQAGMYVFVTTPD